MVNNENVVQSELLQLENLLNEITEWEKNYIKTSPCKKIQNIKEKVQTVEVYFTPNGQIDLEHLENKIRNCNEEYIKVRIPSGIDLYLSPSCNNTSECRRREKAKKIAEYFV